MLTFKKYIIHGIKRVGVSVNDFRGFWESPVTS